MKKSLSVYLMAASLMLSANAIAAGTVGNSQSVQTQDLGEQRTDFLINSFKVEGNKNVDLSRVIPELGINIGDQFSPNKITEAAQKILSTGYFSNVAPTVKRVGNSKNVSVLFTVTENPIIRNVSIKGSTLFTEQQLIDAAGLKRGMVLNGLSLNPQTSPILQLYQEKGVVTASITGIDVSEKGDVAITLSEGVVRSVEYKKVSSRKDNKRLTTKNFVIKTKPYILERMTYVKEGDILTSQALDATLKEFYRTGLFSSIEPKVEGDINDLNGRKVTFVLDERPTTSINAQVAYETKEGLTGGLTLADKNFMGRQQDVSISANFGTKGNYDFNASYFDPWIAGTDRLQAGANIFFRKNRVKESEEKESLEIPKADMKPDEYTEFSDIEAFKKIAKSYTYGGGITLGKGVYKNKIFVTAKPKIYGVKAVTEKGNVIIDYTLAGLALSASYDTRNDSFKPIKGMYITVGAEANYIFRENSLSPEGVRDLNKKIKEFSEARDTSIKSGNKNTYTEINKKYEALGKIADKSSSEYKEKEKEYTAELDKIKENEKEAIDKEFKDFYEKAKKSKTRFFYSVNADARFYHPVYKDKNSMAYRLNLGYSSNKAPEGMLPTTDNGGTTLRGYNPETTTAYVIGTVENRTYINDYVQIVAFAEAGVNTKAKPINGHDYDENGNKNYESIKEMFKKDNLRADIGIGTRLNTPLGVIRLDYAWPLINKDKDMKRSGRISFGFGQTF